ncbi:MAG TPA: helix-turn-helix transcriptional regulator, partial [Thermoanaerobaculia bacterium]
MTEPAGSEAFYGDAIHLLRWRREWTVETLAVEAGVSKGTILNYEHGRTVPGLEVRREIACALDVALGDLDGLAADLWRRFSGLAAGGDRLAAEVAADLAADFHRAALPLVKKLAAVQVSPPQSAAEEEVRALAPVLRRLGVQELRARVDKLPSLWRWPFVKLVGEESERAASVDAGRALELASFALQVAERITGEEGWVCRVFGWALLANARRVGNELAEAEEALACSARLQAAPPEGRPELPERWRLLDLEASLRITQRRLPEALRLLDEAAEVAPQTGPVRARI